MGMELCREKCVLLLMKTGKVDCLGFMAYQPL